MAQATNPVTGRPSSPDRASETPDDIADDIRTTRSDMGETIDAISAKLDPSNLVDQAKEAFSNSARDAGASLLDAAKDSSVLDTIKANPVPALAVGLSLAWFVSKLGESESDRYRTEQYAATGDPYYAPRPQPGARRPPVYGPGPGAARSSASLDGGSSGPDLKDKATHALGAAKEALTGAAEAVGDRASGLAGTTSGGTHAAPRHGRDGSGQAASWLDRQLDQNPLAVGAMALAAGALVGLSVPESRAENKWMGDQADATKAQALRLAEDKAGDAREAAGSVMEEAKTQADALAEGAKQTAEDIGRDAPSRATQAGDEAADDGVRSTSAATGSERALTPPTGPMSKTMRPSKLSDRDVPR